MILKTINRAKFLFVKSNENFLKIAVKIGGVMPALLKN